MSRELKFRAWDKTNKRMICDCTRFSIENGSVYQMLFWGNIKVNTLSDEFVIGQYTGLKNKNGVDLDWCFILHAVPVVVIPQFLPMFVIYFCAFVAHKNPVSFIFNICRILASLNTFIVARPNNSLAQRVRS